MQAHRDESEGQDFHQAQATAAIPLQAPKDGTGHDHEGPEIAPDSEEILPSETRGVQSQAHREEERAALDQLQAAVSTVEIQSVQQEIEILQVESLQIPGGRYSRTESSSRASKLYSENAEPARSSTMRQENEQEDLILQGEFFQFPDEREGWTCQQCASYYRNVRPDFVVPEKFRRDLQLQAQPWPLQADIEIPVISLNSLMVDEMSSEDEKFMVKCQISEACRERGIFQVRDHGIPESLLESAVDAARRFFDLRHEEKMKYLRKNSDESGYGGWKSSYSRNWGDNLLHILHLEKSLQENDFPEQPHRYGEFMLRYAKLVNVLHMQLIDACAQVQDVDVTDVETALRDEHLNIIAQSYDIPFKDMLVIASIDNEGAKVASSSDDREALVKTVAGNIIECAPLHVNYHPPCPQPELVLAIDPRYARAAFEIVLENQVLGLQILKDGRWWTVEPQPNALVVMVGKALESVSRDLTHQYKAVMFRKLANREKALIGINLAVGVYLKTTVQF